MAISLIRKNAAEVTAYDDTVMFDEAILNQNGILLNVGNQMTPYAEGANFNIKDGYAILYGRQFKIEGTETIVLTKPSSGNLFYLIYAKLDTSGSAESITLVATYNTSDYPSTPTSQDLIKNRAGVAYLGLFRAKVNSTGIVEVSTVAPLIQSKKYIDDNITKTRNDLTSYVDNKDTNRKNYIDTKVTEINNTYTPLIRNAKFEFVGKYSSSNPVNLFSLLSNENEQLLIFHTPASTGYPGVEFSNVTVKTTFLTGQGDYEAASSALYVVYRAMSSGDQAPGLQFDRTSAFIARLVGLRLDLHAISGYIDTYRSFTSQQSFDIRATDLSKANFKLTGSELIIYKLGREAI